MVQVELALVMRMRGVSPITQTLTKTPEYGVNAPVPSDEAAFEKLILPKSGETVVLNFWAEWCGPCKMMIEKPLKEAAEELGNKAKIVHVDVFHYAQVASKFGVSSIPTLLVLGEDGIAKAKRIGLCSKDDIVAFIENTRA